MLQEVPVAPPPLLVAAATFRPVWRVWWRGAGIIAYLPFASDRVPERLEELAELCRLLEAEIDRRCNADAR